MNIWSKTRSSFFNKIIQNYLYIYWPPGFRGLLVFQKEWSPFLRSRNVNFHVFYDLSEMVCRRLLNEVGWLGWLILLFKFIIPLYGTLWDDRRPKLSLKTLEKYWKTQTKLTITKIAKSIIPLGGMTMGWSLPPRPTGGKGRVPPIACGSAIGGVSHPTPCRRVVLRVPPYALQGVGQGTPPLPPTRAIAQEVPYIPYQGVGVGMGGMTMGWLIPLLI